MVRPERVKAVDIPFEPVRHEDPFPGHVETNLSGEVKLVPEEGKEAHLESLWAAFTARQPRLNTSLAAPPP